MVVLCPNALVVVSVCLIPSGRFVLASLLESLLEAMSIMGPRSIIINVSFNGKTSERMNE